MLPKVKSHKKKELTTINYAIWQDGGRGTLDRSAFSGLGGMTAKCSGLNREWKMRKQKRDTQRVLSRSSAIKGQQRNEATRIGVEDGFLLFLPTFYFQRHRKVERAV